MADKPPHTDRTRLLTTASPDAMEAKRVQGMHTAQLAEETQVAEAKRQETKELALYILDVMIHEGNFKDMRLPDSREQHFDIPPEAQAELDGEDVRTLYIKRELLTDLAPDFPDEEIEAAMSLLASAITVLAPKGYGGFARMRPFALFDYQTERFGQNEYQLMFPFDMILDNDAVRDTDPNVERDNMDELILGKLAEWSDPDQNPDYELDGASDEDREPKSALECAMDYVLDRDKFDDKSISFGGRC